MLFFPQILPSGLFQYPVTRHVQQRVVENVTPGGTMYRRVDDGCRFVNWDLVFESIGNEQRRAVDTFFEECRGNLHPFVFLDPFQNLVRRSESFEDTVWEREPALIVASGQPDPMGTSRACRISNATSISRSLLQRLTLPTWFSYSASCWFRANDESLVELAAHPASIPGGSGLTVTAEWKRYRIVVRHQSSEVDLQAGFRLPGNTEIYAFGFQLEQFEVLSEYKKTENGSGIYANARFAGETLRWITTGIEHHSTRLSITAPLLP